MTGADRLQTILYAIVPQIIPPFVSYLIYQWDINIRMATITLREPHSRLVTRRLSSILSASITITLCG